MRHMRPALLRLQHVAQLDFLGSSSRGRRADTRETIPWNAVQSEIAKRALSAPPLRRPYPSFVDLDQLSRPKDHHLGFSEQRAQGAAEQICQNVNLPMCLRNFGRRFVLGCIEADLL